MTWLRNGLSIRWTAALAVLITLAGWAAVAPAADEMSTKFTGKAVTEGTVTAPRC